MRIQDCYHPTATVTFLDGGLVLRIFGDDGSIATGAPTVSLIVLGSGGLVAQAHFAIPTEASSLDVAAFGAMLRVLRPEGERCLFRARLDGVLLEPNQHIVQVSVEGKLPPQPLFASSPPAEVPEDQRQAMEILRLLGPELVASALERMPEAERAAFEREIDGDDVDYDPPDSSPYLESTDEED